MARDAINPLLIEQLPNRDLVAAMAMQALVEAHGAYDLDPETIAEKAYAFADALAPAAKKLPAQD